MNHSSVIICVLLACAPPLAIMSSVRALGQERGELEITDSNTIESIMNDEPTPPAKVAAPSGIDLLTLISSGGAFMIPIAMMSILVVALAVERSLSLRRGKILPRELVDELEDLANPIDRFNPGVAMRSCHEHPSPLATVVLSMLRRTGEPLADVERAATESVQWEVDRHASPIRWLTLAAAATPLMGLLGTVWGMIVAFHESTTLTADRSRSEQLSEGIYTALVTTLAGLAVAIPAAILALYLENRLLKMFHRVQETAFEIALGLSRFAGKKRLDKEGNLHKISGGSAVAVGATGKSSVSPPPPELSPPPRDAAVAPGAAKHNQAKTR